jgi:lysophospholipase L1-like esterase
MYRGAVAGTTKPESNVAFLGQTLLQFVDMVKQIAAYEGYGVVDLFTRGPINHGNCDIRTGPYQVCQDGVHPNDRGYDGVAKIMLPVFRAVVFK